MRSIQLVAPRTLEEREMPQPPDPGPGEVAVKVRAVGLCGSDMHWYLHGRMGSVPAVYPRVLGHEAAGEIVAAGGGVTELSEGQRVAIEPSITCGHCEYCMTGAHNNCVESVMMGGPELDGLLLEYAVMPARNAEPVPEDMSFVRATLIETLGVMANILELVEIRAGDTVGVMGAGPVGMLCAAVARMSGASRIFIADKVPHRLELAKTMGADVAIHTVSESVQEVVLEATRGRGVDVAIEAAGAIEMLNAAIGIARPGAQVVQIGIPSELDRMIDLETAMSRELRIQTIKRSNHQGRAGLRLLESGRIPDTLITHRMPLAATPAAFETLAAYADGVGKIVIEIPS